MTGRAAIITFGCKVNQIEAAFLWEQLGARGWQMGDRREQPELVVVNTCTVTGAADRQVRQCLRALARSTPAPRVAVTGCYAQRDAAALTACPGVDWIVGNQEKVRLADIIASPGSGPGPRVEVSPWGAQAGFDRMPVQSFPEHTRAFVKIQDGCENWCSYCVVPGVRGPIRSLPGKEVREQCRRLAARGYREMVLTGINLGQYGRDRGGEESLAGLLAGWREAPLPCRWRLSSLEPQEITPELLDVVSSWESFCPHFHVPLQSGSREILTAMGRPYTPAEFREKIWEIAARYPQAALGTDVMVGFPGESAADFETTRQLLTDLPLAYLHVFPFAARPGTRAAALPQRVPAAEVKARAAVLRRLGSDKRRGFQQQFLGQEVEVLWEGPAKGRPGWLAGMSANYMRVMAPGPPTWHNEIQRVWLTGLSQEGMEGRPTGAVAAT